MRMAVGRLIPAGRKWCTRVLRILLCIIQRMRQQTIYQTSTCPRSKTTKTQHFRNFRNFRRQRKYTSAKKKKILLVLNMTFSLHCVVNHHLLYCVVKIAYENKDLFSSFFEKTWKKVLVFKGNSHHAVGKMVLHNTVKAEVHVQNLKKHPPRKYFFFVFENFGNFWNFGASLLYSWGGWTPDLSSVDVEYAGVATCCSYCRHTMSYVASRSLNPFYIFFISESLCGFVSANRCGIYNHGFLSRWSVVICLLESVVGDRRRSRGWVAETWTFQLVSIYGNSIT